MTLRTSLFAATAVSLALTASAHANDVFVDQTGDDNTALIEQSGTSNVAGTTAIRMLQSGDDNALTINQAGAGNSIGAAGAGLDQAGFVGATGTTNSATITQADGTNVVGVVQQTNTVTDEQGNTLSITQNDATTAGGGNATITTNLISSVIQTVTNADDDTNTATITMDGNDNIIGLVEQVSNADTSGGAGPNVGENIMTINILGNETNDVGGDDTLDDFTTRPEAGGVGATAGTFSQTGGGNLMNFQILGNTTIIGATQIGDHNSVGTVTLNGNGNGIGVHQEGDSNLLTISAIDGNLNDIGLEQDGNFNAATINLSSSSNSNEILVEQNDPAGAAAATNIANIDLLGASDSNEIDVDQNGVNFADIDVEGSTNILDVTQIGTNDGAGAIGVSINILGDSNSLTMSQDTTGFVGSNAATVEITGNSNNSLTSGTAATGNFNGDADTAVTNAAALGTPLTITGGLIDQTLTAAGTNTVNLTIGDRGTTADSDFNLFGVTQSGQGNVVTGVITGGDNNEVAIAQLGNGAVAPNVTNFTQTGSNNILGVVQSN